MADELLPDDMPLCEVIDRLLNKGVVVHGEVTIAVANIPMLYLGLQLVLGSVDAVGKPTLGEGGAR
jgi:hypothetical protein